MSKTTITYEITAGVKPAVCICREIENEMGITPVSIVTDGGICIKYDSDDAQALAEGLITENGYLEINTVK